VARAEQARRTQIERLEAQIADTEHAIRTIEEAMAEPGFYGNRATAQQVIDEHQGLMWKVGELMRQWEELQTATAPADDRQTIP
jgi:prefoldin subunit 5